MITAAMGDIAMSMANLFLQFIYTFCREIPVDLKAERSLCPGITYVVVRIILQTAIF